MTNVMTIGDFPRYLVRASQADHKVIERLLTPGFWQGSVTLDGIVLDASQADRLGQPLRTNPLKSALSDRPIQILLDHQTYRLTDEQNTVRSLSELRYGSLHILGPEHAGYQPQDFSDREVIRRFVRAVFDYQSETGVTDYIAPAFFVESRDSPWLAINQELLRESVREAGTFLYAMVCTSFQAADSGLWDWVGKSAVAGVYVLASPLAATKESIAKLNRYLSFLKGFQAAGLNVIAARQPAFGLIPLALGIAGFDSGIAQSERFDFRVMSRQSHRNPGDGKKMGRSRRIYLSNLLTAVSPELARKILSLSGLRSSFGCSEPCCKDRLSDALLSSREHFLWSRVKEVSEIRSYPPVARARYVADRLMQATQLAKKVRTNFPGVPLDFSHLDSWGRALDVQAGVVSGEDR